MLARGLVLARRLVLALGGACAGIGHLCAFGSSSACSCMLEVLRKGATYLNTHSIHKSMSALIVW